jgi:hypothetical protein
MGQQGWDVPLEVCGCHTGHWPQLLGDRSPCHHTVCHVDVSENLGYPKKGDYNHIPYSLFKKKLFRCILFTLK